MNVGKNGGNSPNYYPNTFNGLNAASKDYKQHVDCVTGDVNREDLKDDDNFSLPIYYWENHIGADERKRMIVNTLALLSLSTRRIQQKILYNIIYNINVDLGNAVKAALKL